MQEMEVFRVIDRFCDLGADSCAQLFWPSLNGASMQAVCLGATKYIQFYIHTSSLPWRLAEP